jgi:DNA mismatch endonuclease (patch repair protein)
MDVHPAATRSYNMSRIRAKDTRPEMLVRRYLHAQGFRYRLHVKDLPGKPDMVLPKYKTVIFIHGCFWHGHEGYSIADLPRTSGVPVER